MKTTKVLLYCTKNTPYLVKNDYSNENEPVYFTHYKEPGSCGLPLNGKILAECEVETEKIRLDLCYGEYEDNIYLYYSFDTPTLNAEELLDKSCLTQKQLSEYLKDKCGYALHIKNLKELETPLTFERNCIYKEQQGFKLVLKAPQNMMRVYDRFGNKYILISIRPEWLCKILNRKKTIEVRRKVLNCLKEII